MENKNDQYGYMRTYSKYFSLTFQMIVLIVMGAFGGRALDNYFHLETHFLSVIMIILATVLSFYLFFKTILKK